jgi:hypothetical protein
VVALAAALASAQTRTTMTGKCNKPSVRQSIPAGDQQDHVFMLTQGQCTITASLNGAVAKQGNYSEEIESTPASMNNRGMYVVTFDNGDKAYFKYQGSGTMKDGALQTATNKWEIIGGTGKMQGINGTGGCKLTGNSDGGVDYSCTGSYHVGMPTGNNSRAKGRTTPVQR